MSDNIDHSLHSIIEDMGRVGQRLARIGACEGSAGNVSIFLAKVCDGIDELFPIDEEYELPYSVPELAGGCFFVTGSGRRLPDLEHNPFGSIGVVTVGVDGESARLHSSPMRLFTRLTCEFNSHLAVHRDRVSVTGIKHHAVIHAQPQYLTFLSHIKDYQDFKGLNTRIYRWQPECIMQIPDGIGYIPFFPPGSSGMESGNLRELRSHTVVLWAKHGVMSRADDSILHACDLIEYLETSAKYEFMNRQIGQVGEGLLLEDIQEICREYNIKQNLF